MNTKTTAPTGVVSSTELGDGSDERWNYYFRVTECKAKTAQDGDCICWHTEGTGPFDTARHDDADQFLEWKELFNVEPTGLGRQEQK